MTHYNNYPLNAITPLTITMQDNYTHKDNYNLRQLPLRTSTSLRQMALRGEGGYKFVIICVVVTLYRDRCPEG